MTVVTITGIRPDFICMSEVFARLDERFDHVMVHTHTGQHYDDELSGTFFRGLRIREPNCVLDVGARGAEGFAGVARGGGVSWADCSRCPDSADRSSSEVARAAAAGEDEGDAAWTI